VHRARILGRLGEHSSVLRATRRGFLAFGTTAVVAAPRRDAEAAVPAPHGEVILTVDGAIGPADPAAPVRFDIDTLLGVGRYSMRTRTPFTDGEPQFDGVLGRSVMRAVQARGARALARARNDYTAEIPLSDFESWEVLLATHMDGRRLQLRDKGPLWFVYPWSRFPELVDRLSRQKSVWQLFRLSIS
jgi:hypothetical protein